MQLVAVASFVLTIVAAQPVQPQDLTTNNNDDAGDQDQVAVRQKRLIGHLLGHLIESSHHHHGE